MKTRTQPSGLLEQPDFRQRRADALTHEPAFFLNKLVTGEVLTEAGFLAALANLKQVEVLPVLRDGIERLKSEIARSEAKLFGLSSAYLYRELEQIGEALTIERAGYYLERLEKALSQVKTSRINDINLNRWKEYEDIHTDSLWIIDRRDGSGVHRASYWGNFVPQIPQQMIKRYTKKGELVLDTFAGMGTTLIESQRLGRHGLGVELQSGVAENARKVVSAEPNAQGVLAEIVIGNSQTENFKTLLPKYGFKSAQLVIMHPPYFDIIKFSDNPEDLSNAASVDAFVEQMGQVVQNAGEVLDKGRHLVLVIGDKYAKGEWLPLGFLTMNEVLKHGFSLKSIIVKNFEETTGKRVQKELWRYRALASGFYVFKHEYIFLFQKK